MATSQADSRPKSMAEAPAPARASRRSRVSSALKSGVVFGGSAVLSAVNNITPHIAGAVDIMVVEQPDGSRKATPFYVRFGKYTALRTGERNVKVYVNDELAPFGMHIGMYGQAYFATETTEVAVADEDTQEAMLAGMMSPPSGYSSGGEGEGEGDASEAGDSNPSPQADSLQAQPRLGRSGSSPSAPGAGSGPGRPRKPGRSRRGEGGSDTSQSAQASVRSSRSLPTPALALGSASAPVLTQPTQQALPNAPVLPSKSQLQLQLQPSAPPGGSSPPVHGYHPSLSLADRNESFLSACETLPTPLGDEQLAAAGINLGTLAASGSVHSLEAAAALERFFSLPQQRAVSGRRRGGVTPEGGRPTGLDRVSQGGEGDQEDEGGRSPTGWSEDGEGEGIRERALGGSSLGASSSGRGGPGEGEGREGADGARCEPSGGDGGSRGGVSPPAGWTPPGAPVSGAAATGGSEIDKDVLPGGHAPASTAAQDVAGQAPRPSHAPPGPAPHPALHMTQQLGFPDNPLLPTPPGASPDYLTPGGRGALAAAACGDDDPNLDPHTAVLYSLPHTEVPVPLQTVPLAAVLAANGSGPPAESEGPAGQGQSRGHTPHVSHAHAPHAVSLLSSSLRSKAGELGTSSPGFSPAPSQRPLASSLWGDGSGPQGGGSGAGGDEQRREQRPVRVSLEATRSGRLHMQLSLPSEAGVTGGAESGAGAGAGSSLQAAAAPGPAPGAGAAAATPFYLGPEGLGSSASLQVHPSTLPQSIPAHQQHTSSQHHDPYDHPHGASVAAGAATGPTPLHSDIPHSASAPVARTGAGPIAALVPPPEPHATQPALPSPPGPRPATGGQGLSLSLCGARLSPGMPYKDAAALFDEHAINEESYIAAGPSLLSSAELCIKLGSGAIYPWHALSSSLLGLLVFGSWRTPPGASCWLPDGLSPADILPPSSAAALLAVADGLAAAGSGGGAAAAAAGRPGLVVPSRSDAGAGAGAGEDSTVGQSPGGTPKKPEQGGQQAGSSWRLWPFGGRRGGAGRGSVTGKSPPLLTSPLAERATSLSGTSSMPLMPARSESTAGAGAGLAAAAAAVVAELAADGDCGPLGAVSAPPVSVAAAAATPVPPLATMSAPVANDPRFTMVTRKSLTPTPEELAALPLQYGQNTISYKIGTTELKAYVYFLPWRTKIVISDIDGTITKSDVLGHLLPPLGWDWSHPGIAQLLTSIRANAYLVMYLSSRSIGQANVTRDFINTLVQGEHRMPLGPVIISPHGLLPSLYREMILRRPHEFKIATLQDIRALFPPFWNPFYGGFGNRDTDEISYREVGVPASRIFIINPKGELRQPDPSTSPPSDDIDHDPELGLGIASPRAPPLPLPPAPRALPPTLSSLAAINDLVHHIFPPLVAGEPLAVAVTHLSAAAAAAAVVAAVTDGEEREQQQRQQQEEEGSKEGRDGDEDGPPQLVALGGREQGAAGGQGKEECDSVRVVITPTVDGAGVQLRLEVRQDAGAGASSPRGGGDQDGGDADGDEGDSSSSSSSSGGVSNGGGLAGASPHSSSASNVSGGAGTRGGGGAAGQGRSPPGSPFAARASELRVEVTAVEVEAVLEPGGGAVGVVAPSAVPQVA